MCCTSMRSQMLGWETRECACWALDQLVEFMQKLTLLDCGCRYCPDAFSLASYDCVICACEVLLLFQLPVL